MSSRKEKLNIFERNDKAKMQGFIDYITDRADGFEAFRERMEMRAIANRSSNTEPDTYYCDCVFVRFFPTFEMLDDFPEIAKDFFLHEFANIPKYDQVEYISDGKFYGNAAEGYIAWVMNLMMNAVKQGSAYTIGLFQNLFQTYYKREYKVLKRFRKISRSEIYDIAGDNGREPIFRMPIIITMCRMFGIEMDPDCSVIYGIYEEFKERFLTDEEPEEVEGFSSEEIDYAFEWVNEELEKADAAYIDFRNPHLRPLKEGVRFINEVEKWLGLKKDFVVDADEESDDYEYAMIRTVEHLRSIDPNREYSFDEVQTYSLLFRAVCALGSYHDYSQECQRRYLGLSADMYVDERERCYFNPEKVKVPSMVADTAKGSGIKREAATVSKKSGAKTSVTTEGREELNDLLDELDALRAIVRKQEQEISFLRDKSWCLDQTLKESQSQKEAYKAEHEELVHLRNHVYQMTEEEQEVPEMDSKAMEKELKDKKIVIIGGHSNWIYKLRNKFSKWVFLKPEINNTFDGSILADADYIYFFTDILSHGTYGKYMKIIRNQGMTNYGYIHSINVSGNIRQIYTDVCGD